MTDEQSARWEKGEERQMKGHFVGALNQGVTPEELAEAVMQASASTQVRSRTTSRWPPVHDAPGQSGV